MATRDGMSPYLNISDYALIGDSRTAALVSNRGSIDWLCLPRFDSGAIFNRLLDYWHGGHFTIAPTSPFSCRRYYEDATALLISEFRTDSGLVRVTDVVPVLSESVKRARLVPLWSLLRRIEGIEGTVELDIVFKPRPDHGRLVPQFHTRGRSGYFADLGARLLHLATDISLEIDRGEVGGTLVVRTGQRATLWFAYSEDAPAVYPLLRDADKAIERTRMFWTTWAERCTYHGPYRTTVLRSALTLKLLSYAPSGAIVAAPTTSLPEVIGGERNWDYRYCWLRDASYTATIFLKIGYAQEAIAFIQWLMYATALTYPALKVLYDIYGDMSFTQGTLDFLEGYRRSQPVCTGNQAQPQSQLDVYGEVFDSIFLYVQAGYSVDRDMRRRLVKMADLVTTQWTFPDHGIWEIPDRRRHYVHSKVMCWVALNRAEQIARHLDLRADLSAWRKARQSIEDTVWRGGFSPQRRSFVQTLGGDTVDATALVFPLVGFIDPGDPRAVSTVEAVRKNLGIDDLLYRYRMDDGLPGQEGAFLPCSFWLVETLASMGRRDEAEGLFQRLQGRANDVGLYSEEIDPADGAALGNFPQALTHLAHIGAALRLDQGRYKAPSTMP
ncbi:MAG: glycoside hydrolase family 15 protein [Nitrospirota bacterium]|nr:glycoside hydrolase family 15 protein [Nitrospirota bacterium]